MSAVCHGEGKPPPPPVTVKVALALVTFPKGLLTTTEKSAPLSPATVGGVVELRAGCSRDIRAVLSPLVTQRRRSLATTLNVAVCPTVAVWFAGS